MVPRRTDPAAGRTRRHTGQPCAVGQDYFAALLHLPQGSGGSAVLRAHPQAIRLLPTPAAELRDIDTRSDLEALRGGKG
mgnify:CR=1 FL=1